MPPHRPWRPAATERRLSLARGSSCLLIRRSARFPISLPGAERKSSRPMSLPDTQGAMLCFNNKLDVGEGSRVSRKHLLIMGGRHLHLRSQRPGGMGLSISSRA